MADNGVVNLLGQMKNEFSRKVSASTDSVIDVDVDVKSENQEESLKSDEELLEKREEKGNREIHKIGEEKLVEDFELKEDTSRKGKSKAKSEPDLDLDKPFKRTRRRLTSRSVIQRAIDRKEKSFNVYEKPKIKRHITRSKNLGIYDVLGKEERVVAVKKQSSPKTTNLSPKDIDQNHLVVTDHTDVDSNLRRSPRTINIENKSGTGPKFEVDNEDMTVAQLNSRLCKCSEDKQLYIDCESDSQFCTAVDSISDKLIGCSRLVDVKNVPMFRPSTRIPFGVFCESHRQRLTKHNCCPSCGIFCTQGSFAECPSKHQFHKDCKLSIGDKQYCPHCGDMALSTDIVITMQSSKKPIFLPVQKSHASARMGFQCPKDERIDIERTQALLPIVPVETMDIFKSKVYVNKSECNIPSLIKAIANGDSKRVTAIIENRSFDLNVRLENCNHGTFLHFAISKGYLDIVYLLVSSGVDIDLLDSDQNSALMLAVSGQKNDIVRYLVKAGAQITLKGIDGMTCLHLAAKSGNLEACTFILETSSLSPNFVNWQDDGGWTPLVWACEHGYVAVAKYLISQNADIYLRDVEHNVALHWAAFKGSSDIVNLLLNLNNDINVLNIHGDTPLHISAREDHYNCVIIFLSRKADISIVNKNEETPLDCAPKDGLCFIPLALNAQLQSAINSSEPFNRKNLLTNDISKGRELNPIQCYNSIDSAEEPTNYTYIKKNCVTSESVQINTNIAIIRSCNCGDRCKPTECECAKLSIKCWYDNQGKLLPDFNYLDPPLIFECNDMCSCNAILCNNRLVQKPLSQRFQLFRTSTKGWGVKSLNFIASGNYVCEYIGEILTDMLAEGREDDSYLFDLDNRDTDSYCIDAKYFGNFARFINHSCNPNLHPVKVFIEHHDLRFPRISLFAKRDIAAEEELSFDYGDKFWLVKYKSFTCDCQADCCKYSKDTISLTLEKYKMTS